MKKLVRSLPAIAATILLAGFSHVGDGNNSNELSIGSKIPNADLKMMDVSGMEVSLNSIAD